MTAEKMIELASMYYAKLSNPNTTPLRADPALNGAGMPISQVDRHLAWMCERIIKNAHNDGIKMQRWLGFVQGVMWRDGYYTVDQLRGHNAEEMSIP